MLREARTPLNSESEGRNSVAHPKVATRNSSSNHFHPQDLWATMDSIELCPQCHHTHATRSYDEELGAVTAHLRDATSPTSSSRSYLDGLMSEATKALEGYDEELERLNATVQRLQDGRDKVQTFYTRYDSIRRSRVRTLPTEIFAVIFSHLQDTYAVIAAAGVCKRWRNILHNFPRYWTTIDLAIKDDYFSRNAVLQEILQRSRDQPIGLKISFKCESDHGRYVTPSYFYSLLSRDGSLSKRLTRLALRLSVEQGASDQSDDLFEDLHLLCLQELHIVAPVESCLKSLPILPDLRVLSLDFGFYKKAVIKSSSRYFPPAKVVKIHSAHIADVIKLFSGNKLFSGKKHGSHRTGGDSHILPFTSEIEISRCYGECSFGNNLDSIEMPRVERLVIVNPDDGSSLDPCPWDGGRSPTLHKLISSIGVPNARHLTLAGCAIQPAFTHLIPSHLTSLEIGPLRNHSQQKTKTIIAFVRKNARLKSLSIHEDGQRVLNTPLIKSFIVPKSIQSSTQFLAPELKNVEFTLYPDRKPLDFCKVLVEMVLSRRRPAGDSAVVQLESLRLNVGPMAFPTSFDAGGCEVMTTMRDVIGDEAYEQLEELRMDGFVFITSLSPPRFDK